VNGLKKRKGVIGSSALSLINSWKRLVNDVNKPKPKIVVEQCHGSNKGEDNDDDDKEVTETLNHSRLDKQTLLLYNWFFIFIFY